MNDLEKVVAYMKAHWPSQVKAEWQVGLAEYPAILKKVMADLTGVGGGADGDKTSAGEASTSEMSGESEARGADGAGSDKKIEATTERKFVRIAGISGAGKTTQLMPAVEEYFAAQGLRPVLVAARVFAPYHPHYEEIREFYGEANVRKMTDEFSTIMMFLALKALTERGYDMILDVTLLDPAVEEILVKMLTAGKYDALLLMIAVSPEVTARHLSGRAWRHSAETEREFIRATQLALEFYARECAEMPVVMWNAFDVAPVYEGEARGCLPAFEKWSAEPDREAVDPEARRQAKVEFLRKYVERG